MLNVHFDAAHSDAERRNNLYNGDLYVYSPNAASLEFSRFTREMIESYFAERAPEHAQFDMQVADYAELLGRLKPAFIHHPGSASRLSDVLREFGCATDETYFEVPKLRSSTSDNYLTTGIAYAWHPHRDTWYSAAQCQINWWMPIYPIRSDNCMAFHPRYWSEPVENTSSGYNYYEWNSKFRGQHVTQMLEKDTRPLPAPTHQVDLSSTVRLICPPGGLILFSAAQLHSSVPNTSGRTRFSVDFRTVNLGDLNSGAGAPNLDSACTGSALGEFRRASDLADLPAAMLAKFADGTEHLGAAVFGR